MSPLPACASLRLMRSFEYWGRHHQAGSCSSPQRHAGIEPKAEEGCWASQHHFDLPAALWRAEGSNEVLGGGVREFTLGTRDSGLIKEQVRKFWGFF